jgi:cob(I)alamin adenosyltransferase
VIRGKQVYSEESGYLKNALRIDAYGTIDELNSFIGLAVNEVKNPEIKTS